MGPLRLSDLIGLDTLLAVSESLYDEFRDPASVAPALLNRMVEAGLLGRKSGRGFYDYSKIGPADDGRCAASRLCRHRRGAAQPRIDEWRATTCHPLAPRAHTSVSRNTFDRLF